MNFCSKFYSKFLAQNQLGSALLYTFMIIIGVSTIMGAMAFFVSQYSKITKKNMIRSDLALLQEFVDSRFDCANTKSYSTFSNDCKVTSSHQINLLDRSNIVVLDKSDTSASNRFGEFSIRAKCDACSGGKRKIVVEYIRRNQAGTALRDPLTKTVSTWRNLFPANGRQLTVCQSDAC